MRWFGDYGGLNVSAVHERLIMSDLWWWCQCSGEIGHMYVCSDDVILWYWWLSGWQNCDYDFCGSGCVSDTC